MAQDRSVVHAAFWMVGALVALSLMAVIVKSLSGVFDTYEMMMYRSAFSVVLMMVVLWLFGRWGDIRLTYIKLHIWRNISHFTGQNLWFFAIGALPLAQVFALEFTTPLWVLIFSALFLAERMTVLKALLALAGFGGTIVAIGPIGFEVNGGVITGILCAIGFAGSIIFTKKLTAVETVLSILFFLALTQLIFATVLTCYDGDVQVPDLPQGLLMCLIGCAGLAAHFCITTALSLAPASKVAPIDFCRLPLIAVVGVVFFAEPISWYVILGGSITFLAAYANLVLKS